MIVGTEIFAKFFNNFMEFVIVFYYKNQNTTDRIKSSPFIYKYVVLTKVCFNARHK